MKIQIAAFFIAAMVQFGHSVEAEADGASPCCRTQVVTDYDFYRTHPIFNGPNADWTIWSVPPLDPDYIADDGQITFSIDGGVLDSNPFTKWVPNTPARVLDHVKWLGIANDAVPIPSNGQVIAEWRASVETFKTEDNPFPAGITTGPFDPRFGGAGFYVFDLPSGSLFGHYFTNDRIYAAYERLPLARFFLGNYAAYAFVVPIAKRKPCDWHNFSVTVDGVTKNVIWKVEGVEVLRVKRVGYFLPGYVPTNDLGGNQTDAFPMAINPGFGTFMGVDDYPCTFAPCDDQQSPLSYPLIREGLVNIGKYDPNPQYNPVLGPPTLASFWDSDGEDPTHHIWGQGAVSRFKKLKVSVVSC